jgi:hypothetical protein
MTIARKFTLALLGCVTVAITTVAVVAVQDELRRSESDIEEYEAFTAHALRPAIKDVWLHDGEVRANELIEEAQQRLGNVDIRCVSLDPAAPAGKRPRVEPGALASLAVDHDVVLVDRSYASVGRIFTYVLVNVGAPSPGRCGGRWCATRRSPRSPSRSCPPS